MGGYYYIPTSFKALRLLLYKGKVKSGELRGRIKNSYFV